MAEVNAGVMLEDEDEFTLNRRHEDFAWVEFRSKGSHASTLSLMVNALQARRLREFFNSRAVIEFSEGREPLDIPVALVTGQSLICPECKDRFDPTEDDRDAAFAGESDVLSVLERRYQEHYEGAHRG